MVIQTATNGNKQVRFNQRYVGALSTDSTSQHSIEEHKGGILFSHYNVAHNLCPQGGAIVTFWWPALALVQIGH